MTTTSPTSSYGANAEHWTRIIRQDLDRYRTGLTNAAVLAAAGDVTDRAVLDAGCGEGYLPRLLATRARRDVHLQSEVAFRHRGHQGHGVVRRELSHGSHGRSDWMR